MTHYYLQHANKFEKSYLSDCLTKFPVIGFLAVKSLKSIQVACAAGGIVRAQGSFAGGTLNTSGEAARSMGRNRFD